MLASGAHVSINGVEYLLDESQDEHYIYDYQPLLEAQPEIAGSPGKKQTNPDKLMWSFDDWTGGEGNRIYYADEPYQYNVSNGLNPRVRGQITGRPTYTTTTPGTVDVRKRTMFAVGSGALWVNSSSDGVTDAKLYYTTDGTTWSNTASGFAGMGNKVTAMCGDAEYVYYAGWRSAASGTRQVRRVNRDLTTAAVTKEDVQAEGTGLAAIAGMTMLNGLLYLWTGKKLQQWDVVNGTMPLTGKYKTVVDNVGIEPGAANEIGLKWFADLCATENSIIYFMTTESGWSRAWEYRDDTPTAFWTPPQGFSIRSVCYHSGVVWFVGTDGNTNQAGWGQLWAIPLDTRRPYHVADIRKHANEYHVPTIVAPSIGSSVMIVTQGNLLFEYDPETGGLSEVDNVLFGGTQIPGDAVLWGGKRRILSYDPSAGTPTGSSHQVFAYANDDPTNRVKVGGLYVESGDWDFDLPFDRKMLLGFHLAFEPLTGDQQIVVQYSTNAGSSFTVLTTITTATSGASNGRVYVPVSTSAGSTVKFQKLRFRVYLESTSSLTPILYAATAEAKLISRLRQWQLILKITDEQNQTRPANKARNAQVQRSNIKTAAESLNVVQFKDGYPYPSDRKAQSDTYDVTVEGVRDSIKRSGEGFMVVRLTEVPQ